MNVFPLKKLVILKYYQTVTALFGSATSSSFFVVILASSRGLAVAFLTIGVGMGGISVSPTLPVLCPASLDHRLRKWSLKRYSNLLYINCLKHPFTFFIHSQAVLQSQAYVDTFKEEWREVFLISAEIYIFGALVFLILASGQKQWWADGVMTTRERGSTRTEDSCWQHNKESTPA